MTPHPEHSNLILITEAARREITEDGVDVIQTVRVYADPSADKHSILEAIVGTAYKMLSGDE